MSIEVLQKLVARYDEAPDLEIDKATGKLRIDDPGVDNDILRAVGTTKSRAETREIDQFLSTYTLGAEVESKLRKQLAKLPPPKNELTIAALSKRVQALQSRIDQVGRGCRINVRDLSGPEQHAAEDTMRRCEQTEIPQLEKALAATYNKLSVLQNSDID